MPLSSWRMFLVPPPPWDISTNHQVSSKPGPKINDKHDKDKLEYMEVSLWGGGMPNIPGLNK